MNSTPNASGSPTADVRRTARDRRVERVATRRFAADTDARGSLRGDILQLVHMGIALLSGLIAAVALLLADGRPAYLVTGLGLVLVGAFSVRAYVFEMRVHEQVHALGVASTNAALSQRYGVPVAAADRASSVWEIDGKLVAATLFGRDRLLVNGFELPDPAS